MKALVFFSIVFSISCSNLKIGWNHFERISMFYLDDYIDLPSREKRELKERISQLKKEHMVNYLPGIVDHLDAWITAINSSELKEEKARSLIDKSQKLFLPIKQQLAQETVLLVQKMNSEQRQHLVKEFSKKLDKKRKRSDEQIEEKIEKRFHSNMERFFGDIEDNQMRLLEHFRDDAEIEQKALVMCQAQALQQFKAKLKNDDTSLATFVRSYFTNPDSIQSEECKTLNQQREQRWASTLSQLQPLLSQDQKQHFQDRIRSWQKDLREIYKKEVSIRRSENTCCLKIDKSFS